MKKRLLLLIVAAAALLLVLFAALALWLRASLPQLDGERAVAGLSAPVTVLRDARGAPTLRAANREDLARATGFVHAQDRFFQMDLLRRSSAGELAALVGEAALSADRRARLHGLRRVAREVLAAEPPTRRRLLQAYAEGVNQGLAALAARPPEYGLLRTTPRSWQAEDSVLVIFALYFDLQDERALRDARHGLIYDVLPAAMADFLTAHATAWDAPLDGSRLAAVPLPGPEVYDLRGRETAPEGVARLERTDARSEQRALPAAKADPSGATEVNQRHTSLGSNSWAIGPRVSADGAAWLADDMHLGLAVPNVWYRLRLEWREGGEMHALTGVSLPGAPALVAGSNGHVAWGYTNSYGDFADRVLFELDPEDEGRYRGTDGFQAFRERIETIAVKGAEPVRERYQDTEWGPRLPPDHRGRPQALRWVAHDPEATNLALLELERARSLEQAIDVAHRAGIPVQNFLAVDASGGLGWTLIGRLPDRQGADGALPSPAGSAGWRGYLDPARYPVIIDPPSGRLWTANNRVVGGEALELIGDGGYSLGARAVQIRDALFELEAATPTDLLALQLDDRALFLARWRELLLGLLDETAVADDTRRRELRRRVEDWDARAAVDSVGYRLVRGFRLHAHAAVFQALTVELREADPRFRYFEPQSEAALWSLVTERPAHLLDPAYPSWEALLLAAADELIATLWEPDTGLAEASWGRLNTLRMRHPLSAAVPALGRWLDMPAVPLPGDANMPRVQAPSHGASQRLVVSPGREEQSILHLPGGQSGHPLSPFYRAGHQDWVEGRPTPLLPGEPVHELRLTP